MNVVRRGNYSSGGDSRRALAQDSLRFLAGGAMIGAAGALTCFAGAWLYVCWQRRRTVWP